MFVFISNAAIEIPDSKYQEIIFELIHASNVGERFDTSHSFWSIFGYQKPELRVCAITSHSLQYLVK